MRCEEDKGFYSLVASAFSLCTEKDAELFRSIDVSGVGDNPSLDAGVRKIIWRKAASGGRSNSNRLLWRIAVAAILAATLIIIMLIGVSGTKKPAYEMVLSPEADVMCITFNNNGADTSRGEVEIIVNDEGYATNIAYVGTTQEDLPDIDALVTAALIESGLDPNSPELLTSIVTPFLKKPAYPLAGTTQKHTEFRGSYSIAYFSGEEEICYYSQNVLYDPLITMRAQNVTFQTVEINGCDAIVGYNEKNGEIQMVWADDTWFYMMRFDGCISYVEALAMAQSIQ